MDRALPSIVLVVMTAAVWMAFSEENAARPATLIWLLVPYLVFAGVAFWRMWRDGTLLDLFRFRRGDITVGVLVAAALYLGAFLGQQLIAPRGSKAEGWLIRIYLQIGDPPRDHGAHFWKLAGLVVTVALLEEIVWRGLVQQCLEERFGVRRGWLAASALYATAHVPTMWRLAMPIGKNPLVVFAALFCGTVWGFFVGRRQRLPPMMIAHTLFTYTVVIERPLWTP